MVWNFSLEKEKNVYQSWKSTKGSKPFPEDLSWKITGCKMHQNVKPCGNKEERGVHFKASCNTYSLESDVDDYLKSNI